MWPRALLSLVVAFALVVISGLEPTLQAWGGQAHRLVARLAESRLSARAKQNARALLDDATLADVSTWADREEDRNPRTSPWHYVNIPLGAAAYDRHRDCPLPRAARNTAGDPVRDCVVDRIVDFERRLSDERLGRAARTEALKYLIHLVADIHQPMHTIDTARGGNALDVVAFGSNNCAPRGAAPFACNLHGVWDGTLIAHRRLNDDRYVAELDRTIASNGWSAGNGSPADWANESHALARKAMLPAGAVVDEAYYRSQLPVIEERLARAGLRLAGVLNRLLG